MSDDPLADKIHRGHRAQMLLDDEFFRDLCSDLERDIIARWMSTKGDDVAAREGYFVELRVLKNIRSKLETVKANGGIAQTDLERLIKAQDS